MSGRNYTAPLRKALSEGAQIVCAVSPYSGEEMKYRPRRSGDTRPWVLKSGTVSWRYSGRECKAVTPNGGGPWAVARLLP
jgi:hypothetical protein